MRFGTLGPFLVVDDQGHELPLGGPKQRAVLAILVLHAGDVVSIERLVDELWGEGAPPSAAKTLQVYVSHLRKVLGDGILLTRAGGYVLDTGQGEFDLARFQELAAEGRRALQGGRAGEAAARLREALALWRGPALADFAYEPFAQGEAMRLEELRQATLEDRIDAELELGDHAALVGELETVVRAHPLREHPHAQLMLALYRAGRQADALEVYQRFRGRLADELGLEPGPELRALQSQILDHAPSLLLSAREAAVGAQDAVPSPPGSNPRSTNLPVQARRLVGRERELDELRALLLNGSGTVVTLTGIGGIGKTRLAVAAGHDLLDHFPGGVFIARLAGVRDPGSLLPMIAEALGITGAADEMLVSVLGRRLAEPPTLLVLDNFEQLVAGASIIAELVEQGGDVRVLVTSQVPLRITAERVVPLGPLTDDDAATLFIERASGTVHGFAPDEDDLSAIAQVCSRVDCMPLAIELAAARVGSLGPRLLADRLERPLALLTRGERDAPARQQSLRAAIEWTYGLLDDGPRSLLATLGVCAGAVPLAAIEAIAGAPEGDAELLDRLDSLLDASFARRLEDRPLGIRFLVPQALRDFALERLVESGFEDRTRRRHAEYVASVAHAARLVKWGASDEQRAALAAISGEIRPAVAWAREHDPQLHVRLAAALSAYWLYGGVLAEVDEEFERAYASGVGTASERAWVLTSLAKLRQLVGAGSRAASLADEALAAWRAVDDGVERGLGASYASWVIRWEARYEEAIALAAEGLAAMRPTGDRRLILRGLVFLAHAYADPQDVERAEAVLVEADALAGGDPVWELAAIHGDCELYKGDGAAALAWYTQSLTWTSTTGESHQMLMDLSAIVMALQRFGRDDDALEVFELLRLERARTGRPGDLPAAMHWIRDAVSAASAQVGPEGAAMAVARARAVAVSDRALRVIELANRALRPSDG
jgi:predicted ATPase/DNA-binding SARP family transcriptional activator